MVPSLARHLKASLIGNRFAQIDDCVTGNAFDLNSWIIRIEDYLAGKDDIEEIILTSEQSVVAYHGSQLSLCHELRLSNAELLSLIRGLASTAHSRIDPIFPSCGGQLGSGRHRWHAMIPPAAIDGPILCIRPNKIAKLGLQNFNYPREIQTKIRSALNTRTPIIISGAAGSGKTSLCSALLRDACHSRRTIIIEQYPEIPAESAFWTRLAQSPPNLAGKGRIDSHYLMREALRLRPDVIVFGEIRGSEASEVLKSSLSGHQIFATIHADHPESALDRILALADHRDRHFIQRLSFLSIHLTNLSGRRQVSYFEHLQSMNRGSDGKGT